MSEETDTPEKIIYYDERSIALRTTQSICFVKEHDKTSMLKLLLNDYKNIQVVIIVKSKKKADLLSTLISKEFNALATHGNHRQVQQKEAATKFNLGTLNIIITTDMILKTLELENIKLILSYDLPKITQDYYDRIAFMKEMGEAIALVSPEDEPLLNHIEHNMKKEIEEKVLEGFIASATPTNTSKLKKDRKDKPRHRKNKIKKQNF